MRALLLFRLQKGQRRRHLRLELDKTGTERLRLSAIILKEKKGRTTQ